MAVIIVTGTPGTGKTELALELARQMKYRYIDVNEVIEKEKLKEGFDQKRDTSIVDEAKLSKALVKLAKKGKNLVIDSHMSHCLPAKYANLCIVTKCDLKALKKRLEKKKYKPSKVKENMEAEICEVCLSEAKEAGHNVLVVDTSVKKPKELAKAIIK